MPLGSPIKTNGTSWNTILNGESLTMIDFTSMFSLESHATLIDFERNSPKITL